MNGSPLELWIHSAYAHLIQLKVTHPIPVVGYMRILHSLYNYKSPEIPSNIWLHLQIYKVFNDVYFALVLHLFLCFVHMISFV